MSFKEEVKAGKKANVSAENLKKWREKTGFTGSYKQALRAYLNERRGLTPKGLGSKKYTKGQNEALRQISYRNPEQAKNVKKAYDSALKKPKVKPANVSTNRAAYAKSSKAAGTSAAGMRPKKVDKKPTGGGSDKIMEKKRSLVDTIRNKLSNLKLRDAAGEKLEEKRRGRNRTSPALRGGGMVKKTGMRGGGMVKKTGMKKGGMVKKTGMRKKSIDGIARRGKTRGTNR